jgi:CBS domain-containing protein
VPVVDGTRYCGMVYFDDVVALPRADWPRTQVREVLRDDAPTTEVSDILGAALRLMEDEDVDRLPVLHGDAFVGLVTTGEILKLDSILDRAEGLDQ